MKQIHGTIISAGIKQKGVSKNGAWHKLEVVIKDDAGSLHTFNTFEDRYALLIGELRYWTLLPNTWKDWQGAQHEDWNLAELMDAEMKANGNNH